MAAWRHHRGPLLILLLGWGGLMLWLQIQALQFRADGVWAGHLNIWSDWPLHLAMAHAFADRPPALWLAHHPMFAHGALIYPFGVNLVSGLLLRAGMGLDWAMSLPTLLASLATPLLLYALFLQLLAGAWRALLAVSLFYLGAGLGGLEFLWQTLRAADWAALAYPPLEVSRLDRYDWYSGNVLTGMLLPQRAFVFGFPFALASLLMLLIALRGGVSRPRLLAAAGGLMAGLLPLLHTHSFIALALIGPGLALTHLRSWRVWGLYAAVAGLLGGALAGWLMSLGQGLPNHLRWAPGFSAPGGFLSWLEMWWRLWGLSLPAALLGAMLFRRQGALAAARGMALGGLIGFAFANLWLVQPNRWDNAKIFLWVWLCWTPLVVMALTSLWDWRRGRETPARVLAVMLALGVATTGAVELWRLMRVDRGSYMIASAEQVELAARIRAGTAATAVFLTEPSHNHPVMAFAGRPILLGFTGWIANLGFDYRERDADIPRMFAGGPDAVALLARHRIDYVWIGPGERRRYAVNEAWFAARYPLAFRSQSVRVYAVPGGVADSG